MSIAVWLRMFRMKGKTSVYARQMVSIPSVAIAVGWVMLWFLWPHGARVATRQQVSGATRVAFVKVAENPFSRPMPMHVWKTSESSEDSVTVMPWMVTRPAKVLERNIFTADEAARAMDARPCDIANQRINAYMPVWNDKAVFKDQPGGAMHLTVRLSGALVDRGFKIPEMGTELKKDDKPWFLSAFVQIDEKGKVANVFVEKSSESREINAMVVRMLYRGIVSKAGALCEGHVTINFGQD